MKKQLGLVLIFVVLFMGFSGCIFKGNDGNNDSSDGPAVPIESVSQLVVLNGIPSGFEYLGNTPITADSVNGSFAVADNFIEGAVGAYQNKTLDYYVYAIKFSDVVSAETFVENHKATFIVPNKNDTIQQVQINGHEATRGMSYPTVGGDKVPRYKYFWNNGDIVFIIEGNSNDPAVGLDFAAATGY